MRSQPIVFRLLCLIIVVVIFIVVVVDNVAFVIVIFFDVDIVVKAISKVDLRLLVMEVEFVGSWGFTWMFNVCFKGD